MFSYPVNDELSLKFISLNDTKDIFQLVDKNRTFLSKWLPWVDFIQSEEDSKQFIQNCLQGYLENKSFYTVIRYQNETAGLIGLYKIDRINRTAQIGFWLGEKYTNKGLAQKSVKSLISYAFNELNLNKVESRMAFDHQRARNVVAKLNFTEEGIIRQAEFINGECKDQVVYGLLKDEWKL